MAANGIENANIVVGQSLIPEGGTCRAHGHPRPVPPWHRDACQRSGAGGTSSGSGAGQVDQEQVRLINRGAEGVALQGWVLEDEDGHTYSFPNLFLWRNGTVSVHTAFGEDSVADLYWGLTEAVWDRPEEKIRLRSASGEVVAEVEVGAANAG